MHDEMRHAPDRHLGHVAYSSEEGSSNVASILTVVLFACAVWAQETENLTVGNAKIDVIDCCHVAEVRGEGCRFDGPRFCNNLAPVTPSLSSGILAAQS